MAILNIKTNGDPITVSYSSLHMHKKLNAEMAAMDIQIGDITISIKFKTWSEMIYFCKKHNFEYKDNRDMV